MHPIAQCCGADLTEVHADENYDISCAKCGALYVQASVIETALDRAWMKIEALEAEIARLEQQGK
jgi:hypothetical protein